MPVSCNSWILVSRETGKPLCETWNPKLVARVNTERIEVLTALEWLQRFNRQVKKGKQ